jgi:SAM-dependent methyltransferase
VLAHDHAPHRAGFPPELTERLAALGIGREGARALDMGTGTGTLARLLAARGCRVVGLDPARATLAEARRLAEQDGVRVDQVAARAERAPFRAGAFDVLIAGESWHWFDCPRTGAEARRLLRPGGAVVIARFDLLPIPGNLVAATEELLLAHDPGWTRPTTTGLYPAWVADTTQAGFVDLETFSQDFPVEYTHEAWRARSRASASLSPEAEVRFDDELAAMLRARFPADPQLVPHRLSVLVSHAPR